MEIRQTHTYATLEISFAAYIEISDKLKAAGYDHLFSEPKEDGTCTIDMTGVALVTDPNHWPAPLPPPIPWYRRVCDKHYWEMWWWDFKVKIGLESDMD